MFSYGKIYNLYLFYNYYLIYYFGDKIVSKLNYLIKMKKKYYKNFLKFYFYRNLKFVLIYS